MKNKKMKVEVKLTGFELEIKIKPKGTLTYFEGDKKVYKEKIKCQTKK